MGLQTQRVRQGWLPLCWRRDGGEVKRGGERKPRGYCLRVRAWGDFPGGSVGKNLPADAGNMGIISDPGRSHMPQGS